MNAWSSLNVLPAIRRGVKVPVWKLVTVPCGSLIRGVLTGKGFVASVMESISVLALMAKVWEYRMREREGRGELPPTTESEIASLNR